MNITPETEAKVKLLILQGRKIEAIKLVCDTTKCGLRDAKDFVDGYVPGNSSPLYAMTTQDMDTQLVNLLLQGKKLEAVKLYKDKTHLGLAESKDYVDNLQAGATAIQSKTRTNNKRETQIDQIMGQQSSRVLTSVTSGTSLKKVLLMLLALMVVVGLLMYFFVAV